MSARLAWGLMNQEVRFQEVTVGFPMRALPRLWARSLVRDEQEAADQ